MSTVGSVSDSDSAAHHTPGVASTLQVGLIAFAVYHFAIAALMVFAPHTFFTSIGPFGVQNDHYLRDTATFNLAFGVCLAIAYRVPSWRTPILFCVTLQFALHAINHLADIGAAHPHWIGPFDFASLALATAALAWLTRESTRPLEVQR
ncbi:MAG TPA: hypothetical protein VHT25_05915 [Solirubrobacteraceae bacterium]|jgi:hypothetical protein|nr:hypothetical protein [Solirubrobacteraceae bacterium]